MVLVTAVIVLGALWVTYWYGANQIGAAALDRVATAAAARGYTAECTDIAGSGFPLSVNLSCSRASLKETGGGLQAAVDGFTATTALYRPWTIRSAATGPLAVNLAENELTASWETAESQIDAGIGGLSSIATNLVGLQIDIASSAEALPFDGLTVAQADLAVRPASDQDYRLSGTAQALALHANDSDPLPEIDFAADLNAVDFGDSLGLDPRRALATWISEGGNLQIDDLSMVADAVSASATGTLALSDDGTASGELNLTIVGVEELPDLVESYYPEAREQIEQVIAAVIAFTRPVETPDGPARQMTVLVRNNVVSIGILPIGVIPPLVF